MPKHRPRLMIDFDGVIHAYSRGGEYNGIYDYPVDGIRSFINKMKKKYDICVFTARIGNDPPHHMDLFSTRGEVIEWLIKHDIYFDKLTNKKLPATAYIDDKAVEFTGDWGYVESRINELEITKGWNREDGEKV